MTTGNVACNVSIGKNAYRETGQTSYVSQQLLHSFQTHPRAGIHSRRQLRTSHTPNL
jgi:hypothetical protein